MRVPSTLRFCAVWLSLLAPLSFAEPLGTPETGDIEYLDDEPNSAAEIELGRYLYFDKRLSGNDSQSCATCHNPDLGLGDGMARGLGAGKNRLSRNTPHLYNLAWNVIFMWDGRHSSLEQQVFAPIESGDEMNMPLNILTRKLNVIPLYKKLFKETYGGGVTKARIGRALAAFERTFVVNDTPFDRYIAGNEDAMIPAAVRGMALFNGKASCIACHDGPNFTDNSFHNIGVDSPDVGRFKHQQSPELYRAFKTPGLRNTLLTAPYMHDGSLPTLEAVVRFYNRGGDNKDGLSKIIKPLNLSETEVFDLVAFLGALSQPLVIKRPAYPE